jgi:hypothetical protein
MNMMTRVSILLAVASSGILPSAATAAEPWQTAVREHLKLYGHRNWIVVADSAYPAQTAPGIETIVCDAEQTEVLRFVLARIQESRHARPVIFTDKELAFVPEADAAGISQYRRDIAGLFGEQQVTALPHESLIKRLDTDAHEFKVLIIKTNMAIPYTSVFINLKAAYWGDEPEKRLREAMAAEPNHQE